MATGDLKNNLRKLQTELKLIKYDQDVDIERLIPVDFFFLILCAKHPYTFFTLEFFHHCSSNHLYTYPMIVLWYNEVQSNIAYLKSKWKRFVIYFNFIYEP